MGQPRWIVTCLWVGVALTSCADVRVVETQVIFFAESERCDELRQPATGDPARMNAYIVGLYRPIASSGDESEERCAQCVGDGTCELVDFRCYCGLPVQVTTGALNNQLADLRFEDVDPAGEYCVGFGAMMALELTPRERTLGPAPQCACLDLGEAYRPDRNRVCGLTPLPGEVGENASALIALGECGGGCPFLGFVPRP